MTVELKDEVFELGINLAVTCIAHKRVTDVIYPFVYCLKAKYTAK